MSEVAFRSIKDIHICFFYILFFINLFYFYALYKERINLAFKILPFFYTTITLLIFSGILLLAILKFEVDINTILMALLIIYIFITQIKINKILKRKKRKLTFKKFKKAILLVVISYQILFLWFL